MTKTFRPTLIPTLFTVPAVIVLIILGSWQIQRLQWKNQLINTFLEEVAKPGIEWPIENVDNKSLIYRRIALQGTFLHDNEIYLYQNYKGKPGYGIITPFQLEDESIALVNRGWVPMDKRERDTRPESLTEGIVTIEGLLTESEEQGRFTPDNNIGKNVWFWLDIEEVKRLTGFELSSYIIREIGSYTPNHYPIKADAEIKLRNDHLQYAIIWYSFAVILLTIYYVYHRKPDNPHIK